jgi:hypothetical protein
MYGSSLRVFGLYTIKTPYTSPLSVDLLCKCFLSFLYSSSTTSALSHPLFYFVSCRMKVQQCRRKGYYNIGFMDSDVINENSVIKWPNRTENNIFRALDKQRTCTFIMLPYNFKWLLRLFFSFLQFDNKYIQHFIYICVSTDFTRSYSISRLIKPELCCSTLWGNQ